MKDENVRFYVGGCTGSSVGQGKRGSFGYNTTSFAVAVGTTGIIVDLGTGARKCEQFLEKDGAEEIVILMTHYHLDHISGLPDIHCLYEDRIPVTLFGPNLVAGSHSELSRLIYSHFSAMTCPRKFRADLGSGIQEFIPGKRLVADELTVNTLPMSHPSGCVAYRIKTNAGDIVIATDVELIHGAHHSLARFIDGSEIAVVDMHYEQPEYDGRAETPDGVLAHRETWGHSSPDMIVKLLKQTINRPPVLRLTHHHPYRSLEHLEDMECNTKDLLRSKGVEVNGSLFARENENIILEPKSVECS